MFCRAPYVQRHEHRKGTDVHTLRKLRSDARTSRTTARKESKRWVDVCWLCLRDSRVRKGIRGDALVRVCDAGGAGSLRASLLRSIRLSVSSFCEVGTSVRTSRLKRYCDPSMGSPLNRAVRFATGKICLRPYACSSSSVSSSLRLRFAVTAP